VIEKINCSTALGRLYQMLGFR